MTQAAHGITASLGNGIKSARQEVSNPTASWWSNELGMEELFLRDIGALVKDAGSAIFMLLHTSEGFVVRRELQNYGNMIIHATLSLEQDQKISDYFALK